MRDDGTSSVAKTRRFGAALTDIVTGGAIWPKIYTSRGARAIYKDHLASDCTYRGFERASPDFH